jgi:hypothetical protein
VYEDKPHSYCVESESDRLVSARGIPFPAAIRRNGMGRFLMRWVPVESSVFTAFSYLRHKHELYLKFHSGDVYRYFDFSPEQFEDFLKTESKGRYFASNIRDCFRFELVQRAVSGSRLVGRFYSDE